MHETPDGGLLLPADPIAGRKIAFGARHHFTGTLVFGENEGQVMEVESHTEMQVALVMLARREVVSLENQVRFPWTDRTGAGRTHYFDFRVSLRDGSRIALFVKSAYRAGNELTKDEMHQIGSQVTPDFADRVSVMTEQHIDPIELHNAELVQAVRLPDPEVDAAARRAVAGMLGAARIGDLVDRIGENGRGFRAVARLIRSHELELATHERITYEALVRRRVN